MRALIGTWEMSYDGLKAGMEILEKGGSVDDAVVNAIMKVENEPSYTSVGYGGLPARDGHLSFDSAFMDGETLHFGAIMAAESLENPILSARALCGRPTNCLLTGKGAEEFAIAKGFRLREMRTKESMMEWRKRLSEEAEGKEVPELRAYNEDHDTVCVIGLDDSGRMVVGTSTSGLFMRDPGRVGDTPIVGSGFYCDAAVGGAAATGVGEDIMRGCLSYEIVSLMRGGMSPQEACETAVRGMVGRRLALSEGRGSFSLIAMNKDGEFGAASSEEFAFPYVTASNGSVEVRHAEILAFD